ncbi:MAG: hypothetical protein RR190_00670 [Bacteroidales bacterium]
MNPENSNPVEALLVKLSNILQGSKDSNLDTSSKANYIAWCRPGIPFQASDLQFAAKGLFSEDGEEAKKLLNSAANFSRIANSIPSNNLVDGSFEQNGKTLCDVFENILNNSKIAASSLSSEEKTKVEECRTFLDNPTIIQAYNENMSAYQTAVARYEELRLDAVFEKNGKAVAKFASQGNGLKKNIETAMNTWISLGYKGEVEKKTAEIQQLNQKGLLSLKSKLVNNLESFKVVDPKTNETFFLSTFYPANFINDSNGWSNFTFNTKHSNKYTKDTLMEIKAAVSGMGKSWSFKVDGKYSDAYSLSEIENEEFEISFSLVQVPIGRPWLSPDCLLSGAWKWKTGSDDLSNGENPAKGQMIAYPTTAIFIKNIAIKSLAMKDFNELKERTIEVNAEASFGPIKLSANFNDHRKEVKSTFDSETNTLKVDGMQLIAFKCFALPKCPNPNPNITEWI